MLTPGTLGSLVLYGSHINTCVVCFELSVCSGQGSISVELIWAIHPRRHLATTWKADLEMEGLSLSQTPWLMRESLTSPSLHVFQRDLLIKVVSFPEVCSFQHGDEAYLWDTQRTFIVNSQVALVLWIKNGNYLSAVNVTSSGSMKFCQTAIEDE